VERNVGRLFLIGGAEGDGLLHHFVKMCGGDAARIIVCGTPSESVEDREHAYRKVFEKYGAAEVMEPDITDRHDGAQKEMQDLVKRATGIFYTGGDQLRLTAIVAGTPFGDAVRDRIFNEGLIAGGTSAGSAAMTSTMFISGAAKGSVRRADVGLAPGLGYWRDCVVDTHFAQRGRVSRMLVVFAHNPQILGVGIDEDTAIEVEPGVGFRVYGNGAVFVFDGTVTHSSAPEAADDEVIALTDSAMHVLRKGYSFDLRTKRPMLPDGTVVPPKHAP
jgi:cyanophycinase